MKKAGIAILFSLFLIAGASAQTDSGYEYQIQNKFFQPTQSIQSLDSNGDYVAAATFEPSSSIDDSIFLWKDNTLLWSAQHRTVGTPTDISVSRKGVLLGFDTGEQAVLPAKAETVPDEPVVIASGVSNVIDVDQSTDVLFTASNLNSLDQNVIQAYDADTAYKEGNATYLDGDNAYINKTETGTFQEIEYSQNYIYATVQRAGTQKSQVRTYKVESYEDIELSKKVNVSDLAVDLETYKGEAAVLLDNGDIKLYDSKLNEKRSISFPNSNNADDIGLNEKHVLVYGTSIMYAVNPDTSTVNNLFDIDRSLKPVNAGDWLPANGNTITYTPDTNIFREEGSFGAGGLTQLADWLLQDIGGLSSQNAGYASAFIIILLTTGSLGLLGGSTGAMFGGVLGISISAATGMLPITIIFVMVVIAAIALWSKIAGGGGGASAAEGDM